MKIKVTNHNSNDIDFNSPVYGNKINIPSKKSLVLKVLPSEYEYYKSFLPGIKVSVELLVQPVQDVKEVESVGEDVSATKKKPGRKKVSL